MAGQKYQDETIAGSTYSWTPDVPSHKGIRFEQSYRCHICSLDYPRSEVVFYEGRPYCRASCAGDIKQLRRKKLDTYRKGRDPKSRRY